MTHGRCESGNLPRSRQGLIDRVLDPANSSDRKIAPSEPCVSLGSGGACGCPRRVPEVEGGDRCDGDCPSESATLVEAACEIVVIVSVPRVLLVVPVDLDEWAEAHGVVATEDLGLVALADEGHPTLLPELASVACIASFERRGLISVRREAGGGVLRGVQKEVGGEKAGRVLAEVDSVGNNDVGFVIKVSLVGLDRIGGECRVAVDDEEEVFGSASV